MRVRAVLQRVSEASVSWAEGQSSIGPGYCILLGVAQSDQERDAEYLAGIDLERDVIEQRRAP